jgi:hypothetical protein
MNDLEVLEPYLKYADRYMRFGAMCVIAAAVFMHTSRIVAYRPWPLCQRELAIIVGTMGLALFATLVRHIKKATNPFFLLQSQLDALSHPSGQMLKDRKAHPVVCTQSAKTSRQRGRNQRWLSGCAGLICVLFTASLLWIYIDVVITGTNAIQAPSEYGQSWSTVAASWPPLFVPKALIFSPDDHILWAASDWLLIPMNWSTGGFFHGVGRSQRLADAATRGLFFLW